MAAICLCAAVVRVRGMNAAAFGVTKKRKIGHSGTLGASKWWLMGRLLRITGVGGC